MEQSRAALYKQSDRLMNKSLFIRYTIIFLLVFFMTMGLFLIAGKSFIWVSDPYHQHLPAVYYFSEYMREGIQNLFHGKIYFPTFDLSIGYGSDILTTLNYYAFGDPLNLVYIFFNPSKTEYVYTFLVALRMYLAGFSFIIFTRFFKNEDWAILLGSIVYTFSGFSIVSATLHPFFLNAMIYFPLVLLGVEKIFRQKKPALFMLMIAISLISNFYFAYMILVLAFIYAAVRYLLFSKDKSLVHFLLVLIRFILYTITSLLLSAVLFLPILLGFLNNGRTEIGTSKVMFLYPLAYYFEIFQNMFSPISGATAGIYWSNISLAVIGLFSIILLLLDRGKWNLKLYLSLSIFSISLPFIGKILNGYSYVTNRWVFAFILLVAYIVVKMAPSLLILSKEKLTKLSVIMLGYVAIIFLLRPLFNVNTIFTIVNILFLLFVITILFVRSDFRKSLRTTILFVASLFSIISLMAYKIIPMVPRYLELGSVIPLIKSDPIKMAKSMPDYKNYRVDAERSADYVNSVNASLVNGVNSVANYFSIVPQETMDFFDSMKSSDQRFQINLGGLDDRLYLQTLLSTKYFASNSANPIPPRGYSLVKKENSSEINKTYTLFESQYSLPLGYSYSEGISKSSFDELNPVEKQETMLRGVVLENVIGPLSKVKEKSDVQLHKFEISDTDGVEVIDGKVNVLKPNGSITLKFKGRSDSETYFYLKGIENLSIFEAEESQKKDFERLKGSFDRFYSEPISTMSITAKGVRSNYHTVYSIDNKYNVKSDDFLVNVGYSKEAQNKIVVRFNNKGSFDFESMEIITQPMDNIDKQVADLSEEPLKIRKNSGNSISGEVNFSKSRFLAISIPYSDGWKVFIDGKEQKLELANLMFMGTMIKEGKHQVLFKYETPGIKVGICLSLIGACLFWGCVTISNREGKKRGV